MKIHKIYLCQEDYDYFLSILNNPPESTPALLALLQSKNSPLTCPPHQYIPETTAGIGFCSVCYSDNRNDGNHLEGQ